VKVDLFGELMTVKENLTVEQETRKRLSADLKEEETRNSQLRIFNAELIREKELLIKKEIELS
jgi:hypothetical protein